MLSRGPEPYTPKPLYARAQQGGRPMVMQARCTPSGPVVSAPCPGFVGGSMSCLWVLGSPPRRGCHAGVSRVRPRAPGSAIAGGVAGAPVVLPLGQCDPSRSLSRTNVVNRLTVTAHQTAALVLTTRSFASV